MLAMKYIDSHCHPQYLLDQPEADRASFLKKQFEKLEYLLMVAVCLDDFEKLHPLALLDDRAHMSVGIHPSHAHEGDFFKNVELLKKQAQNQEVKALGETGLDYYHSTQFKSAQWKMFEEHISLSRNLNKPLIVHTRQAQEDTLSFLKQAADLKGVVHCFTEDKIFAKKVIDLGWMISFSGIITFKNSHELRDVVSYVPPEFIMSETDAPYLAPVPYRGKTNLPLYVEYVVDQIALIKGIPLTKMIEILRNNYLRFIGHSI
jgi:TatD DNase family protein